MLYLASCLICTFSAFGNVCSHPCVFYARTSMFHTICWNGWALGFIHILLSGVLPQGSLDLYCWTRADDFEKCLVTFVTWGWVWASGWGSGLYCGGWWDSTQDEGPQQPIKGDLGEDGYRWWDSLPCCEKPIFAENLGSKKRYAFVTLLWAFSLGCE